MISTRRSLESDVNCVQKSLTQRRFSFNYVCIKV